MRGTSFFPNATVNVDISPEYMGVGYVIGPRIAGVMFAGGVLSWMVLVPLLSILGNYMTVPVPAGAGQRPDALADEPGQIWSAYIRYIGAGAVLASGLITLGRTLPTIISSFRESMKGLGAAGGAAQPAHRARPAAARSSWAARWRSPSSWSSCRACRRSATRWPPS